MTEEPTEPWRPLGIRDDADLSASYDTLVDGTPSWLEPSLRRWVTNTIGNSAGVVNRVERLLHLTITDSRLQVPDQVIRYWSKADEHARLRVVDVLVRHRRDNAEALWDERRDLSRLHADAIFSLRDMLTEGGSLWTVDATDSRSLVRRVNSALQAEVDTVISTHSDASRKIAAAWHNCYKIDPQPNYAFGDAVLAVEAMLLPRTTPDGTMGTAVAHVRDTVGKWSVGGLDDPRKASGGTLLAMLQTLWHNQQRHANPDGSITGVTQPEAETAVSLAVTLVHWFSSGLVLKNGVAT